MLKTLKVTSLVAVILAVCGVLAMVVFGLKDNPEVRAFLDSPGILERFKGISGSGDAKKGSSSPLVEQARAFALRIDPPPPPKPVVKDVPKPPVTTVRPTPTPKPPIGPKVAVKPTKFDLVATVVYESVPQKSLALFKSAGNKQEWFRPGEMLGNLEISEIKDGSVVFTQGGRNPQEQFVPDKPQVKSLLKDEQTSRAVSHPGAGGIAVQGPAADRQPRVLAGGVESTDSGNTRTVHPAARTPQPRPDVSSRIQRVRSVPRQPSVQEQKATLENTLTGLEEVMNRQDDSISEEERKRENEMWMELISQLKQEKNNLEKMAETENSSEKDVPRAEDKPSEEKAAENESANDDTAASDDPNGTK